MDRRNFFRSMIGGVAAAAAVRTWPFRVYSFPRDLGLPDCIFPPWKPIDLLGQTLYTTSAAGANYFKVGNILYLHPDQYEAVKAAYLEGVNIEQFRVTDIEETTMTIENIPRHPQAPPSWNAMAIDPLVPDDPLDNETARTIKKLMEMKLLR